MLFNKRNILIVMVILILASLILTVSLFKNSSTHRQPTVNSTKQIESSYSFKTEETTTSSTKIITTTEEQLTSLVQTMSLDEKIGQLFLVRIPESNQIEDIKSYHLGGYLLFGRDVANENKASLKAKINHYQESSNIPILIASDEEGGTVTRISQNREVVSEKFQSPQEIYRKEGMDGVLTDIHKKSDVFRSFGIHTGLYPVADVSTDSDSFIHDRTIGLDTKGTSDYVEKVVSELSHEKIGSTLKHFPGYGDNQDSHTDIVRDTRTLEEIKQSSLPPFEAGIQAGADSILVSHNIVEAIDPNVPASISPSVISILRHDLAFNGVIMTDDMDMAGLADFITQEDAALEALKAGNDLILSSSYQRQIPVVKSAVIMNEYDESEVDASVLRILTWKHKLGIIKLEDE